MDFKSLITKISEMDDKIESVAAPESKQPVRLDEDTELRVLAGVTALTESVIAEKAVSKSQQKAAGAALAAKRGEGEAKGASKEMMKMSTKELEKFAGTKHKGLPEKKKKDESVEEGFDDNAKVGDTKKTQHGTLTKTATGVKHERGYTKEKDEDEDEPKAKKKAKKESIDTEAFKGKFAKMVEAAKPDFLDMDKDGNKKEPMKKAVADKKKGAVGKDEKTDEGIVGGAAKLVGKAIGGVAKGAGALAGVPGGIKKAFGKGKQKSQDTISGDDEKNESKKMKKDKKMVKESVETKLTFKDMVKLVQESGGQQQIDPVDTELFNWASRVAKNKLGEGMKAELYAGLIYERNGGVFQMYDVLSEDQK